MIRILNVVTIMNRAGLESRLMDIYRHIDREKIQFDFYTNRNEKGEFDDEIVSLGGRVIYSNPIAAGRENRKVREFREFLKDHNDYKIMHSHVNEWSTIFCKGAAQAGVPCRIAHSRGANASKSLKALYKNHIKRGLKKYATHYLAVSKEAGIHLFGEKDFNEGKVRVFPNAIDTERFRFDQEIRNRYRKILGLDDSLTVIHVGNLSVVKNHQYLLDIFCEIKRMETVAKLLLVGEGDQRRNIEKFVQENQIQKDVLILGKRSDVPQLLQAADVFVFPSFHEGFPGAVLEAETAGLPCLISDSITKEVMITKNVKAMSIHREPRYWADEVLHYKGFKRSDCVTEVAKAGYDIRSLSEKMESFYKVLYSRIEQH